MQSFVLVGSASKQKEYIEEFLKKHSIPSYLVVTYESFKISDARALQKQISLKLKEGEKRLVVLSSPTPESQQALLKTVEELTLENYFFFLVSSADDLLPTIISRSAIIPLSYIEVVVDDTLTQKIVKLSETNSLSTLSDFLGGEVELSDIEKTLLALRKIVFYSNTPLLQKIKLFKILKSLHSNYKFAKTNNINKKLAFEASFLQS